MLDALPKQWLPQTWRMSSLLSILNQTSTSASSPISRLAPELLISIFELVPLLCRADPPPKSHDIGWIAISHVCRRWRIIALNVPYLWLGISSPTLPWMQEMLLRSQPMSIDVRFNLDALENPYSSWQAFALAMQNIPRMRSLHLTGQVVDTLLRTQYSTPALLLEDLRLELASIPPLGDPFYPDSLFGGETPVLRTLFLKGLSIRLSSPILSALSSLTIHGDTRTPRHTLAQWLDALTRMPKLETLHLVQALSRTPLAGADSNSDSSPSTVALPVLNALLFANNTLADCVAFTSRLAIPSSASVEVRTYVTSAEELSPRALIPSHAHTSITALHITHSATGFSIAGALAAGAMPAFVLSIVIPDPSAVAQAVLAALAHFNVASVHSLLIDLGGLTLDWSRVLSRLPALDAIHVRGAALHVFPPALVRAAADAEPACPGLKRLRFEHRPPAFGARLDKSFFAALKDAVDARAADGMGLEELIVFGEAVLLRPGSEGFEAMGLRKVPREFL